MTLEINLQYFDLTDVLKFLLQTKKTGVLHIEGDSPGRIYCAEGLVVHAVNGTCEGVEALYYMSCVRSGKASFEPDVSAPEHSISEETGKLVETIEKRRVEFENIRKHLPTMDSIIAKTTRDLAADVALRRTDWQILALIDGKRKLSDLITESKLGAFEAMKTIAWLKEKELIYEPEKAARVVSKLTTYLDAFFADFSRNGLIWFKRWASSNDANKEMAAAIEIEEDTMSVNITSELTMDQIDSFVNSFEQIVGTEGPKIYGKVLFRRKFEDFRGKLKEQEE